MATQFLPDEDSLRELFAPHFERGMHVFLEDHPLYGWALKVRFSPESNALPVFDLPPEKMQTAEDAQKYVEYVRDELLVKFLGRRVDE